MLQPKTDRTQIEELMARYASAIDAKQYDEIASCFAADATAQYPGFSGLLKGTSDIVAHMRLALDALDATQHLFTNFIIDIEDDSARLSCEILAQHVRRGVREARRILRADTTRSSSGESLGSGRSSICWPSRGGAPEIGSCSPGRPDRESLAVRRYNCDQVASAFGGRHSQFSAFFGSRFAFFSIARFGSAHSRKVRSRPCV